jgi:hypothetical protein
MSKKQVYAATGTFTETISGGINIATSIDIVTASSTAEAKGIALGIFRKEFPKLNLFGDILLKEIASRPTDGLIELLRKSLKDMVQLRESGDCGFYDEQPLEIEIKQAIESHREP